MDESREKMERICIRGSDNTPSWFGRDVVGSEETGAERAVMKIDFE